MTETNFKHTDLGLIPHDWEVKTLGEIAEYRRGSFPQPYGLPEWYGGVDAMPFVQVADVGEDFRLNQTTKQTISKKAQEYSIFVPKNSVLVTLQGSIGRVAITQYDSFVDRTLAIFQHYIIPMANNYFAHQLSKKFAIEREKAPGGIIKTITKEAFTEFEIPLPPTLAEQERIAGALSSIDTLIGALNEQIEKKRHIKQGTMQQLLTGKKRLAGFSGEWKEVRLGDVAKMNSGGTPTSTNPAYYNGDIPFLSISDMTSSGKYIQSTEKTITQLGLENSSARLFPAGTLMYAMYASIGKCSITNIDTAISQAILGFKLFDALDRDYLYYHFCFIENIVKYMGQTGTQSNLSKKIVEDFELTIPPTIAEQSAIAAVLSGMDTEIAALEQKRDKYIAIKSGMMQDLLTGKIRLV
jgi:type I restriction enzyme S subunit